MSNSSDNSGVVNEYIDRAKARFTLRYAKHLVGVGMDVVIGKHPIDPKRLYATGLSNGGMMVHRVAATHPQRWAAIAPVIDKARQLLEQGEALVPMAFVGNFTTGATIPTALVMRSPANKDAAARAVKMLAEQLDADFVLVLMEAYSLRADKVARYEEILDEYGSLADCPASWRIDVVSLSLETRHGVWVAQVPIRPKGISKKKPK